MPLAPPTQLALEEICSFGCQSVWGVIDQLKNGESVKQAAQLSSEQVALLLAELESVMAVYEGSCENPLLT